MLAFTENRYYFSGRQKLLFNHFLLHPFSLAKPANQKQNRKLFSVTHYPKKLLHTKIKYAANSILATIFDRLNISMKNFFKQQGTNIGSGTQQINKGITAGRLHIAYVNRTMIDSLEYGGSNIEYDENIQYKASVLKEPYKSNCDNYIPAILTCEEEAMLYDKYY